MSYQGDRYYIDKVISGNRNAFAAIVNKHQQHVYSLALKICQNHEEAEEVAQDSFIKAFRSLTSFKGKSSFATWLYRITYNTAISSVRKRNYNILKLEDFPADANDFIREHDSEDEAELEYKRSLLSFALQSLSADDRSLISLYYYQELSVDEIVEIVGITKSNLKVRLHRARKRMEEILTVHIKKIDNIYEKPDLEDNSILKEWVESVGPDRVPEGFMNNIMSRVSLEPVTNLLWYSSPVSRKFRIGYILVFALMAVLALSLPRSKESLLDSIFSFRLPDISLPAINLPSIELPAYIHSEYLLYGILIAGMLVLLDRLLNRLFSTTVK